MTDIAQEKSSPVVTISAFLAEAKALSVTPADAEQLLAHHLGKTTAYIRAFADESLGNVETLSTQLMQLARGYPLAYLIGTQAFWDMDLFVNEHTLIPRPDTEILVETIQQTCPADASLNILDLGTGTGAVAIALSRLFNNANITATDVSAGALSVAKLNAKSWSPKPIQFVQTSWFDGINATFDVIVSNPPYIAEQDVHLPMLKHEPITALTSGVDGLDDIRAIIHSAPKHLAQKGWLFLEHGYDQGNAVRTLFDSSFWQYAQTIKDYGQNDRVTYAQLKDSQST